MKSNETSIEILMESLENYVRINFELTKLKLLNSATKSISSLAVLLIFVFLFFMTILTVSIGLAIWLGIYFDNFVTGFFLIGGIYFFIGVILYLFFRHKLKSSLEDLVVSKLTE